MSLSNPIDEPAQAYVLYYVDNRSKRWEDFNITEIWAVEMVPNLSAWHNKVIKFDYQKDRDTYLPLLPPNCLIITKRNDHLTTTNDTTVSQLAIFLPQLGIDGIRWTLRAKWNHG
jgi:hypothetical protein